MNTKHSLPFPSPVFVLLTDSTKKSKLSSLSPICLLCLSLFLKKTPKKTKKKSALLLNFKLVSVRQERAVHLFGEYLWCGFIKSVRVRISGDARQSARHCGSHVTS